MVHHERRVCIPGGIEQGLQGDPRGNTDGPWTAEWKADPKVKGPTSPEAQTGGHRSNFEQVGWERGCKSHHLSICHASRQRLILRPW